MRPEQFVALVALIALIAIVLFTLATLLGPLGEARQRSRQLAAVTAEADASIGIGMAEEEAVAVLERLAVPHWSGSWPTGGRVVAFERIRLVIRDGRVAERLVAPADSR